jgi:hypothetical protein
MMLAAGLPLSDPFQQICAEVDGARFGADSPAPPQTC